MPPPPPRRLGGNVVGNCNQLQSRFPQEEVSRRRAASFFTTKKCACTRSGEQYARARTEENESARNAAGNEKKKNVLAYVSPDFCPMPVLIHTLPAALRQETYSLQWTGNRNTEGHMDRSLPGGWRWLCGGRAGGNGEQAEAADVQRRSLSDLRCCRCCRFCLLCLLCLLYLLCLPYLLCLLCLPRSLAPSKSILLLRCRPPPEHFFANTVCRGAQATASF